MASNRLPITDSHMLLIWKSLDHCMLWAACTLVYFGFLRAAEFTVPILASFPSSIHLTVQDIAVDGALSPSCMCVTTKASKTDPFRKGADLHIGLGSHPLCAVQAMMAYLSFSGECSRSSFHAARWSSSISCASHRLAPADLLGCWHIWKLFQPQFTHRCSNGRRS